MTHTVLVGTSKCDVEVFHLTRDDSDVMYGTGQTTPKAEKLLSLVSAPAVNVRDETDEDSNKKVLVCGSHDSVNDIAFPRNCEGIFCHLRRNRNSTLENEEL